MEPDEPRAARDDTIIPGEDLSDLGIEQLEAREAALLSELDRTRAMTRSKKAGLAAADSLFKT